MKPIQWPEGATPKDELNDQQKAVIEKAVRYESFNDSEKITQLAVGDERPDHYASLVLEEHWPERHWEIETNGSKDAWARKRGDVESFSDKRRDRKRMENHSGVIRCEKCAVELKQNKRETKGYLDKFRCPSCRTKNQQFDLRARRNDFAAINKEKRRKGKALYLIEASEDIVKIVISVKPKQRLSSLQTSNPDKLKLVAYTFGGDAGGIESELHEKYADCRLKGEWFDLPKGDYERLKKRVKNDNVEKVSTSQTAVLNGGD